MSFVCLKQASAQTWVSIPDTAFVTYLKTLVPSAMSGNQLDISNTLVTTYSNAINVSSKKINDLSGIQYFTSLRNLNCDSNSLTSLPALPDSLNTLYCNNNKLTSLPALPDPLKFLYCYYNSLTSLPALPNSLKLLYCYNNSLTSLPALPNSLADLNCNYNNLSSLPALPNSLTSLDCGGNQLTSLPPLPGSLTWLACWENQLTSLPALPNSLLVINCMSNNLTNLPALNNLLLTLYCAFNQLTSLPALDGSLQDLDCSYNNLTSLPALDGSLQELDCSYNQLTVLPALNYLLVNLSCGHNNLSSLPALNNSLGYLFCDHNQLTGLPALNNSLQYLVCDSNQISCFPLFPVKLYSLNMAANPFTCLPNYISIMGQDTIIYPLCGAAGNLNNCPLAGPACSSNITYTLGTGAQGGHVGFSIISSGYSNTWTFGDPYNKVSLTGLNVQHVYKKDGVYIAQCVVKDAAGQIICISTDSVVITNAPTGIQAVNALSDQVKIYPNPASNNLQVAVSTGQISHVNMFDVLGNEISAGNVELVETWAQIDVSGLNNGVYFIEVKTPEGTCTKKIIVQH